MKRIAAVILCMLLAVSCVSVAFADQLADILQKGEMTIVMEGTYPPWNYADETTGEMMGYDADVARAICEVLGVKANLKACQWDGIFGGFEAGIYDVVVSTVSVTPERAEQYLFSTPYAYDAVCVIVRDDNDAIKTLEDLNGKKTCNTVTSIYAQIAEQFGATVTGVDDLAETLMLVQQGRMDATLNASSTYIDYMMNYPDAPFRIACYAPEADMYAIPVRHGEENLLNAINDALAQLAENGTLAQLSVKHFGLDLTQLQ